MMALYAAMIFFFSPTSVLYQVSLHWIVNRGLATLCFYELWDNFSLEVCEKGSNLSVKSQNVYNISFSQHSRNKTEAFFPTWHFFFSLSSSRPHDLCVQGLSSCYSAQITNVPKECLSQTQLGLNCVWWPVVNRQNKSQSPAYCRTFAFLFLYESLSLRRREQVQEKNTQSLYKKQVEGPENNFQNTVFISTISSSMCIIWSSREWHYHAFLLTRLRWARVPGKSWREKWLEKNLT